MEYKRVRMTEEQARSSFIADMTYSLLMSVEEVFSSPGTGTVVTGFQEIGTVHEGERVTVIHRDGQQTVLEVKEVIHYKGPDERFPDDPSHFVSVRFDLLKEGTIREGDIIIDWTSCGVEPQFTEDLWD